MKYLAKRSRDCVWPVAHPHSVYYFGLYRGLHSTMVSIPATHTAVPGLILRVSQFLRNSSKKLEVVKFIDSTELIEWET